jgi:predicted nucleic acid-binding protein
MDAMVVMDASIWVSQLRPHDVNHDASRLWMERNIAADGLLVAPIFLLVEVAAAISRRTGEPTLARKAIEDLNSLDAIQFVPLDSVLIQAVIEVATDLQLRAGDATCVAVARQLNLPLVTWDEEQLQRGGSLLTTYTPSTFPFELPGQL